MGFTVTVLLGAAADTFKDRHGTAAVNDISSVAIGDFNGDKYGDVVAGDMSGGGAKGGQVTVFRGGTSPISEQNSYKIHQDISKVPGAGEEDDAFGYSVSAGDVDLDGKDDLAIGESTSHSSGVRPAHAWPPARLARTPWASTARTPPSASGSRAHNAG